MQAKTKNILPFGICVAFNENSFDIQGINYGFSHLRAFLMIYPLSQLNVRMFYKFWSIANGYLYIIGVMKIDLGTPI